MKHFAALALVVSLAPGLTLCAESAPKKTASKTVKAAKKNPLPRFVSLDTLDTLRALRGDLAPRLNDQLTPAPPKKIVAAQTKEAAKTLTRMAQLPAGARRIAPASIPRARRQAVPRWVRYPLEFQLGGIGLGSKAVDKDRFNRIDRYGLFAMHGNPTAVVVPVVAPTGGAGGGAAAGGAAPAEGGAARAAAVAPTNLTINQTPPLGAELFPGSQNGELPDWAAAVTVQLDNNHVQWLYNRGTYAMGFVVDRLGYVDAIVMAGIESPIGRTQLEDPVHTIKLGDDFRKVTNRYGYPDSVETYLVNVQASVGVSTGVDAGGGAAGGGGAAVQAGNGAFRTFELRYEQSYNVVFTIRNNRVVRIYIFGDPDFFNDPRRRELRVRY